MGGEDGFLDAVWDGKNVSLFDLSMSVEATRIIVG